MVGANGRPVLEIEGLSISYQTRRGEVPAVRGLSLKVGRGETLGLVGESGCGKSTVAFGVLGFLGRNGRVTGGVIRFEGQDLTGRSQAELNKLRGDRIAMVYQDPLQALNPALKLGEQLSEVLTYHRKIARDEAWERSVKMLRRVYMPDPEAVMERYPHQISGGQQQRVVIAMALLNNPALLILDEPTTALDVTVEAEVLDLMAELKRDFDAGIIYITHNLGVVARVCERMAVMYAGELVEQGSVKDIFKRPGHPYTMGLLSCVPRLGESKATSELKPIRGLLPRPSERGGEACVFAPRCDLAGEDCRTGRPALTEATPGRECRCFRAAETFRTDQVDAPLRQPPREACPEPPRPDPAGPLLTVKGLQVFYSTPARSLGQILGLKAGEKVRAVDGVDLELDKGRAFGIVGESGCGKSTLVKALIGLEEISGGQALFLGRDIGRPVKARKVDLIKEMQMVFQNPDATLNPSYSIGRQIGRPLRRFKTVPAEQVQSEVARLLLAVRLDGSYMERLPRQLSGGEKQRVGIARALASRPSLVICDEPVSALDVSVQAAVINLLLELQRRFGTTLIFIAHDLSVVRFFCDAVAVMYLGQFAEIGPAEAIYSPPYHPYTEALLSAVPIPDPEAEQKKIRLGGTVPSPINPPSGCRFHTRCPRRAEFLPDGGAICARETPPRREVRAGHYLFCHAPMSVLDKVRPVIQVRPEGRRS